MFRNIQKYFPIVFKLGILEVIKLRLCSEMSQIEIARFLAVSIPKTRIVGC